MASFLGQLRANDQLDQQLTGGREAVPSWLSSHPRTALTVHSDAKPSGSGGDRLSPFTTASAKASELFDRNEGESWQKAVAAWPTSGGARMSSRECAICFNALQGN
jgi:hypothetical protein